MPGGVHPQSHHVTDIAVPCRCGTKKGMAKPQNRSGGGFWGGFHRPHAVYGFPFSNRDGLWGPSWGLKGSVVVEHVIYYAD